MIRYVDFTPGVTSEGYNLIAIQVGGVTEWVVRRDFELEALSSIFRALARLEGLATRRLGFRDDPL